MNPGPDTRVHDRVVLDEIELYGELIIAASSSDGPLSEDQIDAILGVRHVREEPPAPESPLGGGRTSALRSAVGRAARLRRSR